MDQVDLDPFAHLQVTYGLVGDDVAGHFQQYCSVLLGQLEANALLVEWAYSLEISPIQAHLAMVNMLGK